MADGRPQKYFGSVNDCPIRAEPTGYQTVVDELRALIEGRYGSPPGPIDATVQRAPDPLGVGQPGDGQRIEHAGDRGHQRQQDDGLAH